MQKYIIHIVILTAILGLSSFQLSAQNVMIDEFGQAPDPSAMLEVNDSTVGFIPPRKGLLIPRMTEALKNAIVLPANGMLIYQTDVDSGFHYNRGTDASPDWIQIINEDLNSTTIEEALIEGNNANSNAIFGIDTLGVDIFTLPQNQLTVNESGGSNTTLQITDLASGTGAADGFHFRIVSGQAFLNNNENGPMIFHTNSLERARLNGTGLGLSTNAPSALLDVVGSATIDRLNLNSNFTFPSTAGLNDQIILTNGAGIGSWTDRNDNLGNHIATQNIELRGNYLSNDGSDQGFAVDDEGDAGVGGINTNLHANFTMFDNTLPIFRVVSSPSPFSFRQLENSGVVQFAENNPADFEADGFGFRLRYMGNSVATDRLQIASMNGGTVSTVMVMKRNDGFVGIGIDEPLTVLHVVHTDAVTDGVSLTNIADNDRWHIQVEDTNGLMLYFNNNLRGNFSSTSGAYFALSDKRAKKQISKENNVIEKLMQLDVLEYHYQDQDNNEQKSIGLLAQQVEEFYPSLVSHSQNQEAEVLTVNYFGVNALAVAAAKEQYSELEDLEKRIARLEKKLSKKRSE